MSDSREQEGKQYHDEPNEAGFSGGATTPQVAEDRGVQEAERIAVPDNDLTSAISSAVAGGTQRDKDEAEDR